MERRFFLIWTKSDRQPTAADYGKAHLLGACFTTSRMMCVCSLSAHETTGMSAVPAIALEEREASLRAFQHAFGFISVLDVGPMHVNGERSPATVRT
jgi:hypothetical protein